MTDNEIIKAWEKVLNNSDEPIGEHWMVFVTTQMAKETFDMLTRQKAEIERLQKSLDNMTDALIKTDEACRKAKSEAYRELAEKLKENTLEVDVSYGYGKEHYTEVVAVVEIDNTLKELTEK